MYKRLAAGYAIFGQGPPEDVLDEARAKGDGQLVTEIAEVQRGECRAHSRGRLGQHSAKHRHKVALVPHLRQKRFCWVFFHV